MKDTPSKVEEKFYRMLMQRSGEERLKMGCSMHATARALVIASIPERNPDAKTRALFLGFYGHEFEPKRRKRILRALRVVAKARGKRARVRVMLEPAERTVGYTLRNPRSRTAPDARKLSGPSPEAGGLELPESRYDKGRI